MRRGQLKTIYHGGPSPANIQKAREVAPSFEHGAAWTPQKMTPHDWPFFLDSGAYHEFANDDYIWDHRDYLDALDDLSKMPRDPDFVVLPDYVGDWTNTVSRAFDHPAGTPDPSYKDVQMGWHRNPYREVQKTGYPYYLAAQPDVTAAKVVQMAVRHDCAGVFLGGPDKYQHRVGEDLVDRAHTADLDVHVGNPSSLAWAFRVGFDSADTSRILQRQLWGRLRRLEDMSDSGSFRTQSKIGGERWR